MAASAVADAAASAAAVLAPDDDTKARADYEKWIESEASKASWDDEEERQKLEDNPASADWKGRLGYGPSIDISRSGLEAIAARQRRAEFEEEQKQRERENLARKRRRKDDGDDEEQDKRGKEDQKTQASSECERLLSQFARRCKKRARQKTKENMLYSSLSELALQVRNTGQVNGIEDGEEDGQDAPGDDDDEPITEGEKRYEKLNKVIDDIYRVSGHKREAAQMEFINAFKMACAPIVYGERDWATGKARFFKRHGITKTQRLVCCVAPRRFGKTVGVAIFTLAMILVVPRLPIIIFATNKRTATSIIQMQNQWLSQLPLGRERKCHALSYIKVIPEEAVPNCRTNADRQVHPDASGIWPMPASKNGTRGVTAKIVIMEEAAYIDPVIWEMICIPLLGVSGTVLLGISTPSSQDNFYGGLISRKNKTTGEDLFHLVLIGMSCEDCRSRGIAAHCSHMRHMLPAWKDSEGQKLLFDVMSEQAYRQEAQGEQMKDRIPCFKAHDVDALWRRKRKRIIGEHGVVFIAVDPSGGSGAVAGGGSEVAMTAFVYDDHDNIVVSTHTHTRASARSHHIPLQRRYHKVLDRDIRGRRNVLTVTGSSSSRPLIRCDSGRCGRCSGSGSDRLASRLRDAYAIGMPDGRSVKEGMELDIQIHDEELPRGRFARLLQVPYRVLEVGDEAERNQDAVPFVGLVRVSDIDFTEVLAGVPGQ